MNTSVKPAVVSTYFALIAEFGSAEIPLDEIAPKYFGMECAKARRAASTHGLPVPAYRAGSQKSPWLISAALLAEHIDRQRQLAKEEWRHFHE